MQSVYRRSIFHLMMILTVSTFNMASGASLKVAVVVDGNVQSFNEILEQTRQEIKLLTSAGAIEFASELCRSGGFDSQSTRKAINELLADTRTDLLICLGPVSSHILAQQRNLSKPALAAHIINSSMQQLPIHKGCSGIDNFTYIDMAIDIKRHISRFQEIRDFKTLHLLIGSFMLDGIPQLSQSLFDAAAEHGVKLTIVRADGDLAATMAQLADAEAVYLAPLIDQSREFRDQLVAAINAAGLPSMSMLGQKSVENGALLSIAAELDTSRLARRIAGNCQRILDGENPAVFPTAFPTGERLSINMQTARKIGIFPTWEQMTDASVVDEENFSVTRKLSVGEVIAMALQNNLQLLARQQEVAAAEEKVMRARSHLRPKIKTFVRQSMIDEDRAESIITPARHATQIGVDLLYVINSERASANIDIQKLFQAAVKYEERALLLDIIKDAATGYLNVLKAKTLQRIQNDNLEVTRANLEIARLREKIGNSGPAEVYRWEIQMLNARQAIIEASAQLKKSEMALNQILDAQQESEFTTADSDIFAEIFFLDYGRIAGYIDNSQSFRTFRDFLSAETFAFSPELQQLNMALQVAKRLHTSSQRRHSRPTLALQGSFNRTVRESGIGADKPALPAPFSSVFKYPDKNDWYAGIELSMPLYEGGDRQAAVKENKAEVKKMELSKNHLMQRLELNTRTALEDARASFSTIGLAKSRSQVAEKALLLVQNAYSRGIVNILDLIDSQNSARIAKEMAANAVFTFLHDFIRVSRAVGSFDFILNPDSNESWYERLKLFYQQARTPIIKRRPAEKSISPLSEPHVKTH